MSSDHFFGAATAFLPVILATILLQARGTTILRVTITIDLLWKPTGHRPGHSSRTWAAYSFLGGQVVSPPRGIFFSVGRSVSVPLPLLFRGPFLLVWCLPEWAIPVESHEHITPLDPIFEVVGPSMLLDVLLVICFSAQPDLPRPVNKGLSPLVATVSVREGQKVLSSLLLDSWAGEKSWNQTWLRVTGLQKMHDYPSMS